MRLIATVSVIAASLVVAAQARAHEPTPAASNSAPRLIFWVNCEHDVVGMSNEQLRSWKGRGVDGFVCMVGRLGGLGGDQEFTGDPDAHLSDRQYRLQRELRNSRIVERADARGLKLYLGVYLANYYNRATPLLEWFDPDWHDKVLARVGELAAAAKLLGFSGLAFDQELYPQQGGAADATWAWDYPRNTHSEAQVREQARRRGAQVMHAIVGSFPRAELAVYSAFFPGDWREVVNNVVNGLIDVSSKRVDIDFWDGMTSVRGYKAIRFFDATFYKTPHLGTWDTALTYLENNVYATFSQRFSNWRYAWSRVHVAPFAWIDDGPQPKPAFDDPRSAAQVAEQLSAFRKWSAGGEFANFAYRRIAAFDYSPYYGAMRAASAPAGPPGPRPTLEISDAARAGGRITVQGIANDDLAIRAVRWSDGRGHRGVARLDWEILSGDYRSDYRWQTRWSITAPVRKRAGKLFIQAVDVEGRSSRPAVVDVREPAGRRSP